MKNVEVPIDLVKTCGLNAAFVYAILRQNTRNGVCTISKEEIENVTGLKPTAIKGTFKTLEQAGMIERNYNPGYATSYYIKDILQDKEPDNLPEIVPAQELPELSKYAVPKQKRKRMPYYVMLDALGSPLATAFVTCEEDIKGISDDREIEKCTIPESWAFTDDTLMVENALKYLAYYSDVRDGEKKEFMNETILCLTESICTGMKGKTHGVAPECIIRRINELIHSRNYSFGQWIWDFARKYSDWTDAHAEKIYNKHNYLKTCAVNYLTETKGGVVPGFMDYDDDDKEIFEGKDWNL